MFRFIYFFSCLLAALPLYAQKKLQLFSPDEQIEVRINLSDRIYYDVFCQGELLLKNNSLRLFLKNDTLGNEPRLLRYKKKQIRENLTPVVPLKFSCIDNHYQALTLDFKGYQVEFRAFNNGVAYRFITKQKKDTVEVMGEDVHIGFPDKYLLHMQQPAGFKTPYEEEYNHLYSDEWQKTDRMALLPLLIDTRKQFKILVSESDLRDYPCLFFRSTGENGMNACFPKVPLSFAEDGDLSMKITREASYIARTAGSRSYPWRYFVITQKDTQLIENTMTCQLATHHEGTNTAWIQPGQASWEWWHDACPYGPDIQFETGCNFNTYKYYIDFAAQFHIPYIILDAGWAATVRDPFKANEQLHLPELIRYGKQKNVGILLWLSWVTVEEHFDLFETYRKWGIKGIKIDFMDRSDQWMVNFYERVAKEAAKHQLLVDFHGSFKPAGLEYTYPNVLSYEGVKGLEQMRGCYPDNSVFLPFIRNAVGPMDYTPGAMISMQPELYSAQRPNSAGVGTRAFQLATFVLFESGLQMLADNPIHYYRERECTEFITQVPVTWDETIALCAEVGEYVVIAKRKGEKWFIGGITNNRMSERELNIPLHFLKKDRTYRITRFEDGINANRQAMDYQRSESHIQHNERLQIRMKRNGGFAAVIE